MTDPCAPHVQESHWITQHSIFEQKYLIFHYTSINRGIGKTGQSEVGVGHTYESAFTPTHTYILLVLLV
jgi:hypothetical protein